MRLKIVLVVNAYLSMFFFSPAANAEAASDTGGATAKDTDSEKQEKNTDRDTGVDADFTNDAPELLDDNPYPNGAPSPPPQKPTAEGAAGNTAPTANPPWVDVHTDSDTNADTKPLNEGPVYLPPAPPPPVDNAAQPEAEEDSSACAKVTCSGRGTCVIKNNEPTCACFAGFIPDSVNGLSCISETALIPQRAAAAPPPSATRDTAIDFETYFRNFKVEFQAPHAEGLLTKFRKAEKKGGWDGGFADYVKRSYKQTQTYGTVMLSFGIPAFAGGIAMHMLYAGYPNHEGLLAGAILLDVSSFALIGAGAALLAVGTKRSRHLERFEKILRQKQRWFSKPSASLVRSNAGTCLLLGVLF